MKERVQDMIVINASQLVRENGYDLASGLGFRGLRGNYTGIDTGVCCAEVAIWRRDCCGQTLVPKTGGVGDEAGLFVPIQGTKSLGRGIFSSS